MIRILTTLGLLLLAFPGRPQIYPSCPAHPMEEAYENPLNDRWLSAYDVKHYHLTLEVSNTDARIAGTAQILVEATGDLDTLVLELQDQLDITKVIIADDPGSMVYPDGNELSFVHHQDAVFMALDRTRFHGDLIQVRIDYEGDAGNDRGFFAGISSKRDSDYGFDVTYTLSEPLQAKDWFPVKQVLSDKIDSVTFELICDKGLLAGSNGLLVKVEDAGSDHVLTWKTDYPMAYYLLSFAVADYMDYSFYASLPGSGDSVLVQNYLYDSQEVLSDWKDQIDETGALITLYSELLSDYPFAEEKYGHSMAPLGGGMEHQTMTTIQDFSFSLVAHELAHQWFGDYVTCGNWQDIWVNEGFASYMEYVAAEHLRGTEYADAWMEDAMSIALGETEGSVYVPGEMVENENRLFSYALSYKKGAILLHMIRYILEDDTLFYDVLRTYLSRYRNGLATGADFQSILEELSELDFSCFFQQWYYGAGYPIFQIFWEQLGDSLIVTSEQTGSAADVTPLFQVPFELDLLKSDGQVRRVRQMQESSRDVYQIPVDGLVERIVFDPDNRLLKTSTVIHRMPLDKPFRFGPNPVTRNLTIRFSNVSTIDAVRITDFSGRELFKANGVENPLVLDFSSYADGPYLLELTTASDSYQERIVKISEN